MNILGRKSVIFEPHFGTLGSHFGAKSAPKDGMFFVYACSVFGPCAMVALLAPKVAPKVPQGSPRDPKRHPKGAPGPPKRHPEAAPGTLKAPHMIHFVTPCC